MHTLLVHLPVGFFLLSFLFDLGSYVTDWPEMTRAAYATMAAGIVSALVAALPGFADFASIRRDAPARKKARLHMVLNLVAVAVYAGSLYLRHGRLEEAATPLGAFGLAVVGIGLLSYSGYLGGELVYNEGVGVGRHRRKCPMPGETIRRRALPGEFVEVAEVEALPEGRTVRVAINETVVAVANVDGEMRAFQDFCSHRYGPLSEGTFHDGKVKCPWHNSCFDLRSGEVTEGPAKVPIKVFPVRIRNGKIEVQAEF